MLYLCQNIVHHMAVYISETEVATLKAVGQFFVVDAE